jgi:hypothetical protein
MGGGNAKHTVTDVAALARGALSRQMRAMGLTSGIYMINSRYTALVR